MSKFDHRKYRPQPQVALSDRQWPGRTIDAAPQWCSVDLRDGNQALLEPMSVEQKKQMWALLLRLGFRQIEIGFPAASQPDYDFCRWLIEARQIPAKVTVQVLVQAREDLIARTYQALEGAERAIVHVYNSTSPVQRERVFGRDRDGITAIARQGAQWVADYAEKYPATDWTFQYSPESFSTTEPDYAVEVCNAVIEVWQPTPERRCIINLPATVEAATPNVFADQVEWFCRHVDRRDSIVVSLHTHNDRGCAVAAAELGVLAGADRVEGTLLGNGERTGNMDIVTMAMNLYSQGVDPELDLSEPDAIIETYTACTALPVHPRHPWVGELVYTAFSGSHQDAINKCLKLQQADEPWNVAYLPIDPRDLGRDYQAVIRVNSQSGKGGVAFVLERDYGLRLPRWMQVELAQLVQQASEARGGEISAAAIHALFVEHFMVSKPLLLHGYHLDREAGRDCIAMELYEAGAWRRASGIGEGALSAAVAALAADLDADIRVVDYSEHALAEGTEAEAAAFVLANVNGQRVAGAATDHDSLAAALRALLAALNRARHAATQAA